MDMLGEITLHDLNIGDADNDGEGEGHEDYGVHGNNGALLMFLKT